MPFQDRLKSPLQRSTIQLNAMLAFVLVATVFAPHTAFAKQPQNYDQNPAGALRNSVAKLGRSFRARPAANRVAPIETENFVVYANDEQLARKVSKEAERFRKELSIQWLGREIPTWRHKCPITVEIGNNAGGETSFAFVPDSSGRGEPIDWRMKIYGPPNRLLDAVLPHEVTHTIFATHFGRPLPRWADEGACTTVEHESERKKNHRMLLEFLTSQPSRGIPFNRMFTMRNYPHDILPLYAQGYSLARFLIAKHGRKHFIDYVGRGLENESQTHELRAWDSATQEFYQYKDLSDLQVDWLAWVKNGSNEVQPDQQPDFSDRLAKSQPGFRSSVYQDAPNNDGDVVTASFVEVASGSDAGLVLENQNLTAKNLAVEGATQSTSAGNVSSASGSWYVREMNRDGASTKLEFNRSPSTGDRIASKGAWTTNQARKVPSNSDSGSKPPAEHDSRLPKRYTSPASTIWR